MEYAVLPCIMHKVVNCKACAPLPTPTTSTLNGKWPSDTWFQRARGRQLKREAEWIERDAERARDKNEV